MTPSPFAVIAGVGPGTGACVARRFARSYPVALLARRPESYEPVIRQIEADGGRAVGVSADVADTDSVARAFERVRAELGEKCAAAVFNASGPFAKKGLLEMTERDLTASLDVSVKGGMLFSQAVMPLLLNTASSSTPHPPTLIYTGATASIKSSAGLSAFSTGKHALRALALSVAREFAPRGVHVAHVVVDGVIDVDGSKPWLKDMAEEAKISPEDIAETYWNLHCQSRRCFSNEVDIRPMLEKW